MKEIEALLKEKDFRGLNAAERKLVLSELSEAEYVSMRSVIVGMQQLQAEEKPLVPREGIRANVRTHMREHKVSGWKSGLGRWISYRIPAYQAAAAVVLLAFALHWIGDSFPARISQPDFSGEIMSLNAKTTNMEFHLGMKIKES